MKINWWDILNQELSQNIEIFIEKLDLQLTQSGDSYRGITSCHGGDSNGLSIYLGDNGYYYWHCWTRECHCKYGSGLIQLAICVLENRNNKITTYDDIREFFKDSDLKSFAEFKKKFTDRKLLYALWKNLKEGRVFHHLTSLKGAFLPVFLNDIILENVGREKKDFTAEP